MTRSFQPYILMVLLVIGLLGCARPRPFADLWVSPRPYQAERQAARPPADALDHSAEVSSAAALENPTGEITLHDAVRLALRQNHALLAEGWGVAAAESDAVQMGRPLNPTASFAVENFAGPDADDLFLRQTLRISQVIELADKRKKRRTLGEAAQRLRAWDYEQKRIEVAGETAKRYLSIVVAQERVTLAERQLKLSKDGYDIADDRVRNGTAPGLERDQAAVRVSLSRIVLEKAKQSLVANRADLAAMWGGDTVTFSQAVGALDGRVKMPDLEVLRQRVSENPRLARWDDEIEQRQAKIDLERANSVTDPSIGGGVRYFSDAEDFAGVFDISWPLPVLDDNRAAVLSARLKLAQSRSMQDQARAEINAELTRAYTRFMAAAVTSRMIREDARPAAEAAYDAALESYEAGQSEYLTVLEAERSLLEIHTQQLDAQRDYQLAVIEMEILTAQSLESDH